MELNSPSKTFAALFFVLFAVPLSGWFATFELVHQSETAYWKYALEHFAVMPEASEPLSVSFSRFCQGQAGEAGARTRRELCSAAENGRTIREICVATAACGVILLGLIFGSRSFAGSNRERMAIIFGPLIRIAILLVGIVSIGQIGLFVYFMYRFGMILSIFNPIWVILILACVGVAGIAAGFRLFVFALEYVKPSTLDLRATALERSVHARLYSFVDSLATKLQAQSPDQIVAGLEPTFFVAASSIRLGSQEQTCKGRTLHVSPSLMRQFNEAEFAAVVGHELGHFRGQDLDYSMKFAPSYSRLSRGVQAISQAPSNYEAFALIPAYVTLNAILFEFSVAERKIRRERELLADQAGALASDSRSLVTALVKGAVFDPNWLGVARASLREISVGRRIANLSKAYAELCRQQLQAIDWVHERALLASSVQPHPVDTHPALVQRVEALNITLDDVGLDDIQAPARASIELVSDAEGVEEELTNLENDHLHASFLKGSVA